MKLLPLTLLIITTAGIALADKKLTYNCINKTVRLGRLEVVDNEHKDGGVVGDAFAEKIVKNMVKWSRYKYVASRNRFPGESIIVTCIQSAGSKQEAIGAIAEQQKIVKEWILKEGH
jgi:hypothetical protein